jgi:hypothetical protein
MLSVAYQTRSAGVAVLAASAFTLPAAATSVAVNDRGAIESLPQTVMLDFETDGSGQDISIAQQGGSIAVASDEFAPMGLRFDRSISVVHDGYNPFRFAQFFEGAVESMNAETGFNAIPGSAVDNFSIIFDVPVRSFGLMVATARVFDGDSDIASPVFRVFDANDGLIETLTFAEASAFVGGSFAEPGDQNVVDHGFVGFSSPSLIGRVEIDKEQAIFDDLVFSPVQIPTPGAMALLGLAGLSMVKRRR